MSGHGHHKVERGATRQDIIIMAVTFLVGMIGGGYLYVVGFAPQFDSMTGQTEEVYEEFVIEGTQYGVSDMPGTLPSFQLLEDGSFRYIPATTDSVMVDAVEGTVPRALLREVKDMLSDDVLSVVSTEMNRDVCASDSIGIDFNYQITKNSVSYELDSCHTGLILGSDISNTLDKLWNYFATQN